MKKYKNYIKSVLITLILGAIVGFITMKFMDYNGLKKPAFAPPEKLFPIMWTILYILMGVSYGRLQDKGLVDKNIKTIYYSQLFVNLLWPIIFFVLKARLVAFIWIVVLAILVLAMVIKFYKKNRITGLLQVPYFIWVVFATYLNFAIYNLNK